MKEKTQKSPEKYENNEEYDYGHNVNNYHSDGEGEVWNTGEK